METTQQEMPRFISHKLVHALKIAQIASASADQERVHSGGDWYLLPADARYAPICVGHDDFYVKHQPQAGGYYVVYENGHTSYCPAGHFEESTTRADRWGLQRRQEPKYGVNLEGRLMKREDSSPIGDEEPIFIFRAKDVHLPAVLLYYLSLLPAGPQRHEVEQRLAAVRGFQTSYRDLVRDPN